MLLVIKLSISSREANGCPNVLVTKANASGNDMLGLREKALIIVSEFNSKVETFSAAQFALGSIGLDRYAFAAALNG